MAPPVPSPIDRIAQGVVTEFCVAKGQLVGFVDVTWLETRIARLIRETIMTEQERCAKVAEKHKGAAAKRRLARGMRLGSLPHDAQNEIVAEERGEDIASEMIVRAIRDLSIAQ
jgi:hypothetical protein